MALWLRYFLPVAAFVLTIGCIGGRQDLPVSEVVGDTAGVFVFAESELFNIDSEMMSEKLATIQLPGAAPRIDSVMAMKAAYLIWADSLLIKYADTFDLETASPALYQQYLDLRRDRILRQMYLEIIDAPTTVSDSAVKAAYEEQIASFLVPDRYRAQHIVISGEGLRYSEDSLSYRELTEAQLDSAAFEMLARIRERIVAGESFDTLAMLYSQDANTSTAGGDLGYFELERMVSPFDSTVEHTPQGEISGIIKTQYGWHIVRVEDFAPAHRLPLDSVYQDLMNTLRDQMLMERARSFMDSLRDAATIVYDTAALAMPDSLHKDTDVMAYLNPQDTVYGNDTLYFGGYRFQAPNFKRFHQIEGELSIEDKVEVLSNLAVQPLVLQAARKLGYFKHPSVVNWSASKLRQYSLSILRKKYLMTDYKPSDEEFQAYYDSHIDDYQVERPVTVQHIVFEDSAIAEHVRDLLNSGVDFMEMVDQYYPGDPDIKRAAADLGAIGPYDMPESFYEAALSTPVGTISHPVKTEYGYHLIKVLNRAYSMEMEQARHTIGPILKREHEREILREFVESRLDRPPVIHWEYVDRLQFPQRSTTPDSPPVIP